MPSVLETLIDKLVLIVKPEAFPGVCYGPTKNQEAMEVLVKWKELPGFEATWESYTNIQQFPSFNLENKVSHWAGSIDRPKPPFRFTYSRRNKSN